MFQLYELQKEWENISHSQKAKPLKEQKTTQNVFVYDRSWFVEK